VCVRVCVVYVCVSYVASTSRFLQGMRQVLKTRLYCSMQSGTTDIMRSGSSFSRQRCRWKRTAPSISHAARCACDMHTCQFRPMCVARETHGQLHTLSLPPLPPPHQPPPSLSLSLSLSYLRHTRRVRAVEAIPVAEHGQRLPRLEQVLLFPPLLEPRALRPQAPGALHNFAL
jgi:hypothetical protein